MPHKLPGTPTDVLSDAVRCFSAWYFHSRINVSFQVGCMQLSGILYDTVHMIQGVML